MTKRPRSYDPTPDELRHCMIDRSTDPPTVIDLTPQQALDQLEEMCRHPYYGYNVQPTEEGIKSVNRMREALQLQILREQKQSSGVNVEPPV